MEILDLVNSFAKRTGTPLSGSRDPIPGAAQSSCMSIPLQEDSEVRFRALSQTPDLTSDWTSEPRTPCSSLVDLSLVIFGSHI